MGALNNSISPSVTCRGIFPRDAVYFVGRVGCADEPYADGGNWPRWPPNSNRKKQ